MTNFINYVYNLFEEYHKTDGHNRNLLRNDIKDMVLTGEQILESGITDFTERQDKYETDKEELEGELEDEIEELKEGHDKYKKVYQKLKNLYQGLKEEKDIGFKYNKLAKIEKIIQGKQGPIIDEIKEAIKQINQF